MLNRHIYTFISIVECGSFLKASQKLYVSPNALIKQINLLEDHLGFPVFQRSHRGITLTDAGQLLYREAVAMAEQSERTLKRARQLEISARNTLRLGVSIMFGSSKIASFDRLVQHLNAFHSDVSISFVPYTDTKKGYLEALGKLGSELDFLLGPTDLTITEETYPYLPLENDPLVVSCVQDHPLASRESVSLENLKHFDLLTVRAGTSVTGAQIMELLTSRRLTTYDWMDYRIFNHLMVEPETLMISTRCWEHMNPRLVTLPVTDWKLSMPVGLVYEKDPSERTLRLVQWLTEVLEGLE